MTSTLINPIVAPDSVECPVCGNYIVMKLWVHMLRHLKRRYPKVRNIRRGSWKCWCGQRVTDEPIKRVDHRTLHEFFPEHLEKHGGATAHWLAHQLGVKE